MRIRRLFAVCLPVLLLSDGNVHALAAGSGKLFRRFNTGGPVIGSTSGYYPARHGSFIALERDTGRIKWRYPMSPIPGSFTHGVASSPAVDQELVFFGGLDGMFYAFRTEG